MEENEKMTRPLSPLEIFYNPAMLEKQNHYRKEWLKFMNVSRGQFYKRLERPFIIDLVLWQIACDEIVLNDKIMHNYETNPKYNFKDVETFEMPEHYIDAYLQTR